MKKREIKTIVAMVEQWIKDSEETYFRIRREMMEVQRFLENKIKEE